MNAISWALLALIILAIVMALRVARKSKGSCSCGSSCEGCKQSCCCEKEQKKP